MADFGRAIVYDAGSPPEDPGSGTPFFMAPEQILRYARDVSFPVDVWGAACVFAGMLFRVERLFQGKHRETQLVKVAEVRAEESNKCCHVRGEADECAVCRDPASLWTISKRPR